MGPYDSLRGTGRTTRMLIEVLKVALTGRAVIVVGWRDHHCVHLLRQFVDMPETNKHVYSVNYTRREVTVGTGKVMFIAGQHHPDFNWHNRLFQGPYSRVPTFLDHHTVEMYEEEEAVREANAARAARLAEAREKSRALVRRSQDRKDTRVLPSVVESDPPMADQGTSSSVSCDVPSDASSPSGGSESSGGSCGTD